jgi:hypothetical protein
MISEWYEQIVVSVTIVALSEALVLKSNKGSVTNAAQAL